LEVLCVSLWAQYGWTLVANVSMDRLEGRLASLHKWTPLVKLLQSVILGGDR
jgi:hypothetical protein